MLLRSYAVAWPPTAIGILRPGQRADSAAGVRRPFALGHPLPEPAKQRPGSGVVPAPGRAQRPDAIGLLEPPGRDQPSGGDVVGDQQLRRNGDAEPGNSGFEQVIQVLEAGSHGQAIGRSEEHTSELQSLMRTSYAVFCLKKKTI